MRVALVLYNTMSRRKEAFEPRIPGHVGIYVCGPTVYSDAHLGHAKSAVSDDLWTTVGSFNLDNRSWRTNLEINLAMEDDALAQAMRARFLGDLEQSEEVTAETIAARRWWLRLLDWLFFLGRSLL